MLYEGVQSLDSGVPIPKFARVCGTFVCDLRNQRDASNPATLGRFLDLKFLYGLVA